ncbi:hypothetical protein L873DRAFT_1788382 [Choiromyces venosus 120613-1]|uniref:Uncharacterized protein n=1 Tax=Choiromyces venosus 120613-1 TaxID=1336337 RepID=A0A3N4JVU3_9PEZI|nr:hypothetical protein L873DRAFT_1788382 [Choiromyces venosus 120613-1]
MTDSTKENEESAMITGDVLMGTHDIPAVSAGEKPEKFPPTPGAIFLTGKPKSVVKEIDRVRLNSIDGPNTNRKKRPWVVVEELPCGEVRVMRVANSFRSSTTQREQGWDAVAMEHRQFFLPIAPTVANGRPVLKLKYDFEGRFVGKSLLYLGIVAVVKSSALRGERCMGYLERSALETIKHERRLLPEQKMAVRQRGGREERGSRNGQWRGRNDEDNGDPKSSNHWNFPLDQILCNGQDKGLNYAHFRSRAGGSGTWSCFSHAPSDIGNSGQSSHINQSGNQSRNQDWSSHPQSHSKPSQSHRQTSGSHRSEEPAHSNILPVQSFIVGRSSDPSVVGYAPSARSGKGENPQPDDGYHQTTKKANKNGSKKRQERTARGRLHQSQQGDTGSV